MLFSFLTSLFCAALIACCLHSYFSVIFKLLLIFRSNYAQSFGKYLHKRVVIVNFVTRDFIFSYVYFSTIAFVGAGIILPDCFTLLRSTFGFLSVLVCQYLTWISILDGINSILSQSIPFLIITRQDTVFIPHYR